MKDKPELVTHQILNKYNLKKALKTKTIEEIASIAKVSKATVMKLLKLFNLDKNIYCIRRTPLTGGLIPTNSYLAKYDTEEKRSSYNLYVGDDIWLKSTIKTLKLDIATLSTMQQIYEREIDDKLFNLNNYEFLLKTYRYCKKHNQPLTYMEENEYGIRPKPKSSKSQITDLTVYNYVKDKYGLSKAMKVARILSNEKNTRKA